MLNMTDRVRLGPIIHQRRKIIRLREQPIHILQLQPLSFRIKEVDARHPAGVEHGKNDICLPADVLN